MRVVIPDATEITIAHGLPDALLSVRDRSAVVVVSQPGAADVAGRVVDALRPAAHLELPDGEAAKTLATLETIYRALTESGVRRDGTVVAVGGGALTDVGGFAAATWLRGIESVYVPTTLLAAVDASIGGKTGINFEGKNLIGAFWHPSRVIIDLDVLGALPASLAREGWAEIVKAGLIADPQLLDAIETEGTGMDLEEAVTRAVRVKAEIVAQDFREAGVRAHLNLGHTIGHAVETTTGVSHGEAVALGLIAETAASRVDRGFSDEQRVIDLVTRIGLPTRAEHAERISLDAVISKDKKSDALGLRMVMLDAIGSPIVARPTRSAIAAAWDAIGLGG